MDMKQQQKMETTGHLFKSIHCVYLNKFCQNTNITGNYCWQPKYRQMYLFGLPTSNTEYCQIPPNASLKASKTYD